MTFSIHLLFHALTKPGCLLDFLEHFPGVFHVFIQLHKGKQVALVSSCPTAPTALTPHHFFSRGLVITELPSWTFILPQPFWSHCGWSQPAQCLIRSYWISAFMYGQKRSNKGNLLLVSMSNSQQPSGIFLRFCLHYPGKQRENQNAFSLSGSFLKTASREGYCHPHFTDEKFDNWSNEEEWQLRKLPEKLLDSGLGHDQDQILFSNIESN